MLSVNCSIHKPLLKLLLCLPCHTFSVLATTGWYETDCSYLFGLKESRRIMLVKQICHQGKKLITNEKLFKLFRLRWEKRLNGIWRLLQRCFLFYKTSRWSMAAAKYPGKSAKARNLLSIHSSQKNIDSVSNIPKKAPKISGAFEGTDFYHTIIDRLSRNR